MAGGHRLCMNDELLSRRIGNTRRRRLINLNLSIALYIRDRLDDSTGPANLNAVCHQAVAHPKMDAWIARGQIPA